MFKNKYRCWFLKLPSSSEEGENKTTSQKIQVFEDMAAIQKGLDILKANLQDEVEEKKAHIFVILGASVSLLTIL